MKAAITTLEVALQTLETNEPISRKEGKIAQADLQFIEIHEIRQAINTLKIIEYCLQWETVPDWAPIKPEA